MSWIWRRSKSRRCRIRRLSLKYTRRRSQTWQSSSKTFKPTRTVSSTCKTRSTSWSRSVSTTRTWRSVWPSCRQSWTRRRTSGRRPLHKRRGSSSAWRKSSRSESTVSSSWLSSASGLRRWSRRSRYSHVRMKTRWLWVWVIMLWGGLLRVVRCKNRSRGWRRRMRCWDRRLRTGLIRTR